MSFSTTLRGYRLKFFSEKIGIGYGNGLAKQSDLVYISYVELLGVAGVKIHGKMILRVSIMYKCKDANNTKKRGVCMRGNRTTRKSLVS